MSKAGRTRHSSSALLPPFHGASETERLLPRVDNVCPIRDPIQQRFTQSGIWKYRCPFRERQVCGHDDRRPLGPPRDHLKQKLRTDVGQRHISHFIQRDQLVLLPTSHQPPDLIVLLRFYQLIHQSRRRGESNPPLLSARGQTQARRQMAFAPYRNRRSTRPVRSARCSRLRPTPESVPPES